MKNLDIILIDKKITSRELADKFGMSRTTMSNYRGGDSQRIDIEYSIQIADYLDVTLDVLFGRTDYIRSWDK